MPKALIWLVIIIGILVTLIVFHLIAPEASADSVPKALPHSETDHWYDNTCCNRMDCEPIPFDAVYETETGYRVDYLSARGFEVHRNVETRLIKHSQDGRFHSCATPWAYYCLYVPSTT